MDKLKRHSSSKAGAVRGPSGSSSHHVAAATQAISWSDIPTAILAQALSCLSFEERCHCTLVCANWRAIIYSAAAHARDQSDIPMPDTRTLTCDVCATEEQQQLKLQQCPAIRYAPSAALTLNEFAPTTMQQLTSLTRLVLVDPDVLRQQLDGEAFVHTPLKAAVPVGLQQLSRLAVLSVAMRSPLLDVAALPPSLAALHLDFSSGFSVKQLTGVCEALAAAGGRLPHLAHISMGMELDALLSSSGAAGVAPLARLTQLTSLAFVEYQYMHPECSAHEGYALVPPVVSELRGLQALRLTANSGHSVDLTPAVAVDDVSLVLTLAHYETTPFNRLPSSLGCVTGLTSLSLVMAEFAYEPERDLYIFDARPLAALPKLRRLLLELSGVKCALHDLQGLADIRALTELIVLLKCPDVHEARPDGLALSVASSGSAGTALLPDAELADWDAEAGGSSGGGGLLASVQRVPGKLLSLFGGGGHASTSTQQQAATQQQHQRGSSAAHRRSGSSSGVAGGGSGGITARALAEHGGLQPGLVSEEWVLALVDHALDQLKPEFALSLPLVSGKLLVATTSRLHLRQPENFVAARQPALMASHVQLDLSNCGDCWGGESFLHPMSASALRSWVARCWAPEGVDLLPAGRYPVLGTYPGCKKRIDDRLSIAVRRGVGGAAVVDAVMATAESQCMSYFC